MKKLILVLAILAVAAPAFALDINLIKLAGNNVQIRYSGADPCNLPRAFALVIDVNGGKADVNGIVSTGSNAYKTGVSTSTSRGYGIYPATITINGAGDVNNWGSPIASAADPLPAGADQNLPSNKLVLEFGSLYSPVHDGTNSPAIDGNLCVLTIDWNSATGDVNINMTGENSYRVSGAANSGIVLEDGTVLTVNKSLTYACAGDPNVNTCWDNVNKCFGQSKGDATCDGSIGFADLVKLKQSFGKAKGQAGYNCCADFNHDNSVGFADLVKLKQNFGTSGYVPSTSTQTCPP